MMRKLLALLITLSLCACKSKLDPQPPAKFASAVKAYEATLEEQLAQQRVEQHKVDQDRYDQCQTLHGHYFRDWHKDEVSVEVNERDEPYGTATVHYHRSCMRCGMVETKEQQEEVRE